MRTRPEAAHHESASCHRSSSNFPHTRARRTGRPIEKPCVEGKASRNSHGKEPPTSAAPNRTTQSCHARVAWVQRSGMAIRAIRLRGWRRPTTSTYRAAYWGECKAWTSAPCWQREDEDAPRLPPSTLTPLARVQTRTTTMLLCISQRMACVFWSSCFS